MPLNNRQLRFLRGLTHKLHPVVIVADKGLTENVLAEIESALEHHELIKVKVAAERDERAAIAAEMVARTGAIQVHGIGQMVILFRRNTKKPKVALPSA